MAFSPTLYAAGIYTLDAPFNTLLIPGVSYTCTAVRTLASIVKNGGDPQADFYTPYDLTDADYQRDALANASIVTLQAAGHDAVDVPNTYITGAPDRGGISYTPLMLTIKLGALPDTQDLSVIRQKVADDVLELLGVDAIANVVAIAPSALIPVDQSKTIEAARQGKIGTVITDYTKLVQAQAQLESAQQKIAQLEAYIRTKLT